ncbi:hypothetical protein Q8A67_024812 [Cirrhinus molitorella]|uniref:Ig-like domain-containing protein n=1 Tax=Cirrhinus molitorella TaxID=172907 RepID=A0AA88P2K8_9TELE|nr:hypothetical protein Q8A67_024812 [Cirrhinus molitorella]
MTITGPKVKPSVSLLPPSSLQISGDSAALLCLLSSYSPQGAQVSWTLDGSEVTEGVQTSVESERDGRYSRSSVLSLSKAAWENAECFVCRFVSLWVTFGSGTKLDVGSVTRPKVSVLPPSSAEISSKKTATLVCVANKGFPSDWSLSWKVDGSSRSQESSAGVLEKDGLYSWSSSLTLSEQEWMKSIYVSCEATRSGQPALTGHVTRHQCSE